MNELKLGKNIIKYRRKIGITQDQLASYMGVSKSSVSKWETGYSFPDITLLPELATLFSVSVDDLMGYEPQLTLEMINKIYHELANQFSLHPEETRIECEDYIKKYYACYPFLYHMALLYLNHNILFDDQNVLLDRAMELCKRIEQECEDSILVKESLSLQAVITTMANRPQETLQILGENVRPFSQDAELIAASFLQLGDMKKADEILQVCIYQHLLFMIQDSNSLLIQRLQDKQFCEATMLRISHIIEDYHIAHLHLPTAIQFYLSAATYYLQYQQIEEALQMIEAYTDAVSKEKDIKWIRIDGDDYFTNIKGWFEQMKMDTKAPRGELLVKEGIVTALYENPIFESIKEEPRFQDCIKKLKALS